ncbi:recombinase family protein [Candidatus Nitrospira salsa]
MKVAIYARVSTGEQSVTMQLLDLRSYCQQRGLAIYQEYCDEAVSGTKDNRAALNALWNDARKRKFDAVLCWRFDRFARSTKQLITGLEEFRHLAIDFISYQENIDTSSPLGKAVFTIVGAIAELERNIIVERIKGGLRKAKEQGKKLGRRPIIDGRVIETIHSMRNQGVSLRDIGKTLKVSKSLVHKSCQKLNPPSSKISTT